MTTRIDLKKVPIKIQQITNANCQIDRHADCPAVSNSTRDIRIVMVCNCPCHEYRVIPRSEQRQLWKDKYGEKEDI